MDEQTDGLTVIGHQVILRIKGIHYKLFIFGKFDKTTLNPLFKLLLLLLVDHAFPGRFIVINDLLFQAAFNVARKTF